MTSTDARQDRSTAALLRAVPAPTWLTLGAVVGGRLWSYELTHLELANGQVVSFWRADLVGLTAALLTVVAFGWLLLRGRRAGRLRGRRAGRLRGRRALASAGDVRVPVPGVPTASLVPTASHADRVPAWALMVGAAGLLLGLTLALGSVDGIGGASAHLAGR